MKVDLKPWLPDDKNFKANSGLFVGTTIQSFGLGKYSVQIVFLGLAVPSRVVGTAEEAEKLEAAIWEAME